MESVFDLIDNDGVTGIGSTIKSCTDSVIFCEDIDKFTFTFVTPLTSKNNAEFSIVSVNAFLLWGCTESSYL